MENEVLSVIYNRASLRDYDEKPLKREEEDAIIEAALRAPTAGNQMLYSIIIVRDKEKKEKLSLLCDNQMFIKKSPFILLFVSDQHRWFDYYRKNGVEDFCIKNSLKFAPAGQGDLVLAMEDTMASAENSVIAAESLGIGSCYIGDILENYEKVKELFDLPSETFPLALLCFGYPKERHKKVLRNRFKREYVVFEDCYKQLDDDEYDLMFKERSCEFKENNIYKAKNFAQMFYARKMAAPFRHEMNRSAEEALKKWNK